MREVQDNTPSPSTVHIRSSPHISAPEFPSVHLPTRPIRTALPPARNTCALANSSLIKDRTSESGKPNDIDSVNVQRIPRKDGPSLRSKQLSTSRPSTFTQHSVHAYQTALDQDFCDTWVKKKDASGSSNEDGHKNVCPMDPMLQSVELLNVIDYGKYSSLFVQRENLPPCSSSYISNMSCPIQYQE